MARYTGPTLRLSRREGTDLKYGFSRSNKDGSIHLHSRKIEFQHPVSKKTIKITANPPKNVIWDLCNN